VRGFGRDSDKSLKSQYHENRDTYVYKVHTDTVYTFIHCNKRFAVFPSLAGMSLITLFLDGNNLIIPGRGL
jgi:hypothetical protein